MARTRLSMKLRNETEQTIQSVDNQMNHQDLLDIEQPINLQERHEELHQTNSAYIVTQATSSNTKNVDIFKWLIVVCLLVCIVKDDNQSDIVEAQATFKSTNKIALLQKEINHLETSLDLIQARLENVSLWIGNNQAGKLISSQLTHNHPVGTKSSVKSLLNWFSTKKFDLDYINVLVKQALYVYNADKTGMADFALESMGGSILSSHCSASYSKSLSVFGLFSSSNSDNKPELTIKPNVLPGECWSFYGSNGVLVIKLSDTVTPIGFSIEHIPKVLSPNGKIDSAPKDFAVYGHINKYKRDQGFFLGTFKYDIDSIDYLQYFSVKKSIENQFSIIEFKFESNHGNAEYTCIYRVRVHGVLSTI
jgi:hypothetical protein